MNLITYIARCCKVLNDILKKVKRNDRYLIKDTDAYLSEGTGENNEENLEKSSHWPKLEARNSIKIEQAYLLLDREFGLVILILWAHSSNLRF